MRGELLTKEKPMSSKSNSGKEFYPVIHCVALEQGGSGHALTNVRIATDNHVDGVFLIGHNVAADDLCTIYEQVRQQFPNLWIGINFLDVSINFKTLGMYHLLKKCIRLNALWVDQMPTQAWKDDWNLPIFAGVAFKYINPHQDGADLAGTCEDAVRFASVATTSGDKTGSPPNVEKLKEIKRLLAGRIPIAVASGIDSGNVVAMKPFVDIFMVASSIIKRDPDRGGQEYLVPEKVRELADLIHA